MSEASMSEEVYVMPVGVEFDLRAPCCTWAKFGVSVVVMAYPVGAPALGSIDTFRLDRMPVEKRLEPSDVVSTAAATVAANVGAGVNTRIERQFSSGVGGLRIVNNLNVSLFKVVVTWRPLTTHVIERRRP